MYSIYHLRIFIIAIFIIVGACFIDNGSKAVFDYYDSINRQEEKAEISLGIKRINV